MGRSGCLLHGSRSRLEAAARGLAASAATDEIALIPVLGAGGLEFKSPRPDHLLLYFQFNLVDMDESRVHRAALQVAGDR
jgi:hypothetical protein